MGQILVRNAFLKPSQNYPPNPRKNMIAKSNQHYHCNNLQFVKYLLQKGKAVLRTLEAKNRVEDLKRTLEIYQYTILYYHNQIAVSGFHFTSVGFFGESATIQPFNVSIQH